jgi:hypothetical protein
MQQWHSQIYSQCKGVQLLLQLSMISWKLHAQAQA